MLRHYFKGVVTSWVSGSTLTLTGDVLRVQGVYTGITTYQEYVFYHNFLAPSSNRYTPDHFILDHYYVNLPSPTHINPLPINIQIKRRPGTYDQYLSIDSLNFPDLYWLDLPQIAPKWPR
jgi:hypothetical protein